MPDAISDNRSLINAADSTTGWVNVSGATAGTLDNDTFVQGTGSVGFNLTNSIEGLLYNRGSASSLAGAHLYVWFNCGIAGRLDTQAGGGVRVRFCGSTISNFFEFYVAGSDTYDGGWVMFVVDVDAARATAITNGWTGGTPPATTAIQYVGVVGDTAGFMSRKQDNFWVDAIWSLAANTPGMLVEGRNGGATPWTFADILAASIAGGWGMCRQTRGGTLVLNAPVRFGTNDAVTHGFADSNVRLEWDAQPVASTFYGLTVTGGSGAQSFSLGAVSGSGDDRAGSQGCIIGARPTGTRWYLDADDANVDVCNLYGCTFLHGGVFQLDGANVATISTSFVDCQSLRVDNSTFLRNFIIAAATADGVACLTTDDLTDVRYCSFIFSDGHAVDLTTPRVASQASVGNQFSGYGGTAGSNPTPSSGSTDAAVYNNTAGAVQIDVSEGGDTPSVRNGASATTVVSNPVIFTLTGLVPGTEIRIFRVSDGVELAGTESSGTTFAYPYEYLSDTDVRVVVQAYAYVWQLLADTLGSTSRSRVVIQQVDRDVLP